MLSEDEIRQFLVQAQQKRASLWRRLSDSRPRSIWEIRGERPEELDRRFEMASREVMLLAVILEYQGDPFAADQEPEAMPFGYVPPKELDEVETALAENRKMTHDEIVSYYGRRVFSQSGEGIIFSASCLRDIAEFLENLNKD